MVATWFSSRTAENAQGRVVCPTMAGSMLRSQVVGAFDESPETFWRNCAGYARRIGVEAPGIEL